MKNPYKRILFFLLLPALLFLTASRARPPEAGYKLVTQVDVTTDSATRTYIQPKKMASVLKYLRLLQYRGKPSADSQITQQDNYVITLYYSDGSQRVYRQRSYLYFSKNFRPWEKVDPAQAQLLYPLLQLLPSDL